MPAPAWSIPAKPGLRAPRHERDFFMGLEELQGGRPELALQRFEAAARRDTRGRALSDDLLAGLTALALGNPDKAAPISRSSSRARSPCPTGSCRGTRPSWRSSCRSRPPWAP
jgi:hypothetical protein